MPPRIGVDSAGPARHGSAFPRSGGEHPVARPELGIKRQCQSCGAKFYDLSRDPIICPKCGTIYQVVAAGATCQAEPPVIDEVHERQIELLQSWRTKRAADRCLVG